MYPYFLLFPIKEIHHTSDKETIRIVNKANRAIIVAGLIFTLVLYPFGLYLIEVKTTKAFLITSILTFLPIAYYWIMVLKLLPQRDPKDVLKKIKKDKAKKVMISKYLHRRELMIVMFVFTFSYPILLLIAMFVSFAPL